MQNKHFDAFSCLQNSKNKRFATFLLLKYWKKMLFGYFSVGCFRYEFCHLWVRFWDGSWCVVNLKSYSFQNGYGYVQEAKISAREAQLPIRSEKHLKLKFWQTSRFLNVFSDFPLVQATLDVDVARCECGINMVVGALYTLGLTLSKHDMIRFASDAPSTIFFKIH